MQVWNYKMSQFTYYMNASISDIAKRKIVYILGLELVKVLEGMNSEGG